MPTTIASQIEQLEENLRTSRKQLEETELKLRLKEDGQSAPALNERLKHECEVLGDQVKTYELELKRLRGENRKTMFVSVAILVIALAVYYLYSSLTSS